ncbi:MAG: hypothetical protein WC188_12915 [Candidatus Caldatribacteriota bacterium]
MNEGLKYIIKNNAFYGYKIIVDENIGFIKCPKMDDLQETMLLYISLVADCINIYEDNKDNYYYLMLSDEHYFQNFLSVLHFFIQIEKINFIDNKIYFNDENFIDENNIILFMETLRILHHYDKKDDDYLPANKIAAEMMKRAKKLKKEMEAKIKSKDGIGFLEISSTVSARHPSINPTNIGQLNYYQIIEQYKRLMMIDAYTPCLYGNATEEYIKKNNVKHYHSKIINED